MGKLRLTMAQALVKFLDNQYLEVDGEEHKFVKGIFAIFGHGNVLGMGQALEQDSGEMRVYQGRNEQGMAHVATGFARQSLRRQIIACTSSTHFLHSLFSGKDRDLKIQRQRVLYRGLTEKRWKAITNEITTIYPELYNYIYSLGPNLPEEDFQYCCLYLFGFDTNTEAKLLNIAPNSVSKKRSRLKLKLNITFPTNSSLYEYLIKNMH